MVINLLELIQVMQKIVMIEVGNIESFIDKFKNKEIKELEKINRIRGNETETRKRIKTQKSKTKKFNKQ